MFPFDIEEDEIEVETEEEKEPADYEIDFKTGMLTGRIITGLEAVKQWAILALNIERYKFCQYSWNYGSEFNSLIGKNHSNEYLKSELKRMVDDALSVNEYILEIDDFDFSVEKDKLSVSFTINTSYGKGEINV